MRVTIDVSVIGLARLYQTARTGIYRVISSLAPELLRLNDDMEVQVTSLSSTRVNRLTRQFFEELHEADRFVGVRHLEERLFDVASAVGPVDRWQLAERLVARLFRKMRRQDIGRGCDVFHSTFAALPGYSAPVLSFLSIYDIIPVLHPQYFWKDFDKEFREILASVRPEQDFVLTISESSKNDICEYLGMAEERVFVTYPAAAADLYHPEPDRVKIRRVLDRYGIAEAGYVLSLATLEHRKNLRATIEGYRRLVAEHPQDARSLVLVGARGWKVERVLTQIQEDEMLRDRVVMTGYVRDEDLSSLYSGAAVFVYPSLYEGFGLPPLEAMCCGVPVITSNTSSLPEVVGSAGITVAPDDMDALADALLRVLGESDVAQELAARGLERARQFSWEQCAKATMAAYQQAWNDRG